MTTQNQTENVNKPSTTPQDDAAPKGAKRSDAKRELTDDEIAGVVGGLNPQPLPPRHDLT